MRKEAARCPFKVDRTILHYQDAVEEPVEDNADNLRIRVNMDERGAFSYETHRRSHA